jgi:adenylate cyclase
MADNPNHTATVSPSDQTWTVTRNGTVVAESSSVMLVHESYQGRDMPPVPYFPTEDVVVDLDGPTGHNTTCPVKGRADYYSIGGDDDLVNSIWFYPEPLSPLEPIAGYVAFYGDRFDIAAS